MSPFFCVLASVNKPSQIYYLGKAFAELWISILSVTTEDDARQISLQYLVQEN